LRSLFLLVAACSLATSAYADEGELILGEYGSLTGSEAVFGKSTHNGIVIAVDEINAAGGIHGRKVRLISYDDQGKTSEVGTAVTRLITNDKVVAVIGEVSSSLSIAGGQISQQHQTPMVSPSSTNEKVTEVGDYVFRVCFIDPFQGYVMARFTTSPPSEHGLGLSHIAVLIDQRQAYAQGLARYFEGFLRKFGGHIVAKESYQGGDQDFSAQLTRIVSSGADALYVPGYYTDVANIGKQARALGFKGPLLGGDGWESVQNIGGIAMDGSYYSNHYSTDDPRDSVQHYVKKYVQLYGETPDSMSALGYDATMIIRHALDRLPAQEPGDEGLARLRRALRDDLATTRGFDGITGLISLDDHRNAKKPAAVLRIDGKNTPLAASIPPPEGDFAAESEAALKLIGDADAPKKSFGTAELGQLLVKGIAVGSLYALIALGYTMVYGILQFINFAHSDVFMLGAFFALRFAGAFGMTRPSPLQATGLLLLAMACCALVGFLIERLAYRPLRQAPRLNVLITAIGVSLFIENVGQLVFGKNVFQFPTLEEHTLVIAGISVRSVELVAIGLAVSLMIGLEILVYRTKIGRAMRAVAHDHNVAGLMGIPIDRIISLVFVLGSVLAAAGGLIVGLTYGQVKQPADASWVLYGLKAFVAAVIGGIGNIPGAMLGGLLLGLSEELVAGFVSTTFRDAIAFSLLIVILLVRPNGLLGRRVVEKV
jgi:branched-chain amino acid transport system substrate-binding protein